MMPKDVSTEEVVIEMLRKTSPCCLDDLVTSLPNLSWVEVFVAVHRMSRDGQLLLRQIGYSSYQITLSSQLPSSRSPYCQNDAHP